MLTLGVDAISAFSMIVRVFIDVDVEVSKPLHERIFALRRTQWKPPYGRLELVIPLDEIAPLACALGTQSHDVLAREVDWCVPIIIPSEVREFVRYRDPLAHQLTD